MNSSIKDLATLFKEFDTGMLTTRSPFGHLTSRPMALQEPRDKQALWLVSTEDTSSVENIHNDSHVNMSLRRSSDQAWVSIGASAKICRDTSLISELWQDDWSVWIENKQKAVIIDLDPLQIDFWEPEKSKLGQLFELAKAKVTEERPDFGPVRTLHVSDTLLAPALKGEHQ